MKGKEIVVGHKKHITRLLVVVVVILVGFFVMRSFLIPASFGKYGHYRGDNVKEQVNVPLVHMESAFCKDCHDIQYSDWKSDEHLTINCEVCHGHWEIHN